MTASGHSVDQAYLRYQYDDAEKLRVRIDTHARYSQRTTDTFASWLLRHIDARQGDVLLDVGCGPGAYHPALAERGVRIAGLDGSPGMLREALALAASGAYRADAMTGDAQALAYRDASFDRVMANHMLYHVPDQPAALREMRRVLKPGGRVVLATNGTDNLAEFDRLHRRAAERLGYVAAPHDALRFTLDDLPLVRSVFPAAEMFVRNDALVFPEAAPAVRFYASYAIDAIKERPPDGRHRAPLLREMGTEIAAIIARAGAFRVAKTAGCFAAGV